MARFMGTVQGNRGMASRLGSSNMSVQANGWKGGIDVELYLRWDNHDTSEAATKREEWCRITMTSGSNGGPTLEIYHGPLNGAPEVNYQLTKN